MRGRAWFAASALLVACCGGGSIARRETAAPTEHGRLEELQTEIDSLDERFEQATSLSGIDCREVCDLSARICGLADDICGISESHPEDPHAAERCEDARRRCERAGTEATARCGCRAP